MLLLLVTRKIDKNKANVDFLSFRDKIYTWQTQGLWANILLAQKVSLDVSEKKVCVTFSHFLAQMFFLFVFSLFPATTITTFFKCFHCI